MFVYDSLDHSEYVNPFILRFILMTKNISDSYNSYYITIKSTGMRRGIAFGRIQKYWESFKFKLHSHT